jgi:hypothetical protein
MPLETDGMTLLFLVDINTSNSKEPINFTVFSKEKNLSNPNTVIVINQAKEPIRIYAGGSDLKIKTGSMDKAIVKTNKKGSFPLTIYKIIDKEPIKAFHSFFRSKKGQSLFLFVSPNKKDASRLNVHQIAYRDPDLTENFADQVEETMEPEIKRKKSLSEGRNQNPQTEIVVSNYGYAECCSIHRLNGIIRFQFKAKILISFF